MSNTMDDDAQQRFALGLVFILIALVVSAVLGVVVVESRGATSGGVAVSARNVSSAQNLTPAPTEPAALAPAAIVLNERAAVRVDGAVVKFFFATGKADVAQGADEALAQVLQGVQAGKRVLISGFHDATGDVAVNEALSKRRAQAVQAKLIRLGVAPERVQLAKPAQTLANGSNDEARRVEVVLID